MAISMRKGANVMSVHTVKRKFGKQLQSNAPFLKDPSYAIRHKTHMLDLHPGSCSQRTAPQTLK